MASKEERDRAIKQAADIVQNGAPFTRRAKSPRDEERQAKARRANMAKARKARQDAAKRRLVDGRKQVAAYRLWITEEAAAYQQMVFARQMFGPDSDQAHRAHRDWRGMWRAKPGTPSDSMWRQIEGRHAE